MRRLASDLVLSEQRERRRIARMLHDDLQQILYSLQMQLAALAACVERGSREELEAAAATAGARLDSAIQATRRLTVDLSPPVLGGEGLGRALSWLAAQMREMHELEVQLRLAREIDIENEDLRVLLFQVVRELLFNVVKHAGVKEATVELGENDTDVWVEVADRGRGFEVGSAALDGTGADGVGLASVIERLKLVGGSLKIESALGNGTRARVRAPRRPTHLRKQVDGPM